MQLLIVDNTHEPPHPTGQTLQIFWPYTAGRRAWIAWLTDVFFPLAKGDIVPLFEKMTGWNGENRINSPGQMEG